MALLQDAHHFAGYIVGFRRTGGLGATVKVFGTSKVNGLYSLAGVQAGQYY